MLEMLKRIRLLITESEKNTFKEGYKYELRTSEWA